MKDFEPKTAFEGWVFKAITNLEEEVSEHQLEAKSRWNNHLKHHQRLEARLIYWGITLSGLSTFVGWMLRGFFK